MVDLDEGLFKIQEVGSLQLKRVIEERVPLGKYWTESSAEVYVAVDNSSGDAWTEEFNDKDIMLDWLNNKFEVGEIEEWKIEKHNKKVETNEYQEALNILKPNDHDVIHHKDGWWSRQNNAVSSIQELVDRDKPKQVIYEHTLKQFGKCSVCNALVSIRFHRQFCGDCGNRLIWGGKKE